MKVSISGRHMDVSDAMRQHVESGLDKIRSHFDKVTHADVVLTVEKHRHIAEINLHVNGAYIHGKESSNDMFSAMDKVLTKIDKQVQKYKDRITRRQPRTAREARSYSHNIIELMPEIAPAEDVEMVAAEMDEDERHRVVLREKLPALPFTVREALAELKLSNDDFFAFENAETQQLNVIYARDDGTFGLIEP